MKHASTCCAKGRRYCCCQRERCRRDWPDRRETSSVVQNVCRYTRTGKESPSYHSTKVKAALLITLTFVLIFMFLCYQMILSWTGARLDGGQYEKANVNATDNHSSTCMHYAAAAGMKICVEVRESVWRSILWLR